MSDTRPLAEQAISAVQALQANLRGMPTHPALDKDFREALDEILDALLALWHQTRTDLEAPAFMGITHGEYKEWVERSGRWA